MPPQPPFLLALNVFDRITCYPAATLSASGTATSSDVRYVADYRRERTTWQAAAAQLSNYAASDLGVGATAPVDTVVLDRGHNLWGKTIRIDGDDGAGGGLVTVLTRTLPASGTVGGDPATTWCVTEEGAAYAFTTSATKRRWLVYVTDNYQPTITGIILGQRAQLAGYSRKFDEDAGRRSQRAEESPAGYVASDRVYAGRTLELDLSEVGAATYDAQVRSLRKLLFERNQPAFIAMDYGTRPERAWLYRLDMTTWSFAARRTSRAGTLAFRELYPLIQ